MFETEPTDSPEYAKNLQETTLLGDAGPCAENPFAAQQACLHHEDAARDYLLSHCWPDGHPVCPRCGHAKTYALANERLRCASCRYSFRAFSGRWLDSGSISCSQWLRLIELFVEGVTVGDAAPKTGLAYNTVYKAFTAIRFAILAHATDARQFIGPETRLDSFFKGTRLTGGPAKMHMDNIPVYGILGGNEYVFIDLVPNLNAETLFHFHLNFHLRLKRSGNLIFSAPYKDYSTLLLCGNDHLPYGCIRRDEDPLPLEQDTRQFRSWLQNSIRRFRGVSCQRFPLYLKELEFRFNNRHKSLAPIIAAYLCDFVHKVLPATSDER